MLKKNHLVIYACTVIIALSYLVINHIITGNTNIYFILVLVLIGVVNLYRMFNKKVI